MSTTLTNLYEPLRSRYGVRGIGECLPPIRLATITEVDSSLELDGESQSSNLNNCSTQVDDVEVMGSEVSCPSVDPITLPREGCESSEASTFLKSPDESCQCNGSTNTVPTTEIVAHFLREGEEEVKNDSTL